MDQNYPTRKEMFDVVMIKKGINDMTAKPEDFKRVSVEATDPIAAQTDDKVIAENEYRVLFATRPGVPTDPETMARRRVYEGHVTDPTKI